MVSKSRIRQQKARIAKKIGTTINAIDRLQKSTKSIAEQGLLTAKTTLASAVDLEDFTQKHGEFLVDEIGISKFSASGYKVYAPITQGDNEIAYEMYFAEYGAGLGASVAKNTPKGATEFIYIPTKVNEEGYWFYPLIAPQEVVKKNGEIDVVTAKYTNTSVAVNYMWAARQTMKIYLNKEIENCQKRMGFKFKKLAPKTSITRPKG